MVLVSGLPAFSKFHLNRRNQPQAGCFAGEQTGHAGAPADLLFRRSIRYVVRSRRRSAGGRLNTVKPCLTATLRRCLLIALYINIASKRSASCRSGALKIARKSATPGPRCVTNGKY